MAHVFTDEDRASFKELHSRRIRIAREQKRVRAILQQYPMTPEEYSELMKEVDRRVASGQVTIVAPVYTGDK